VGWAPGLAPRVWGGARPTAREYGAAAREYGAARPRAARVIVAPAVPSAGPASPGRKEGPGVNTGLPKRYGIMPPLCSRRGSGGIADKVL